MFGVSMALDYPVDMLNAYKKMTFSVGGQQVSIAVNAYRNNDAGSHPSAAKGGTQDAISVKDALMSLGAKDVLARTGGASAFVGVFVGKGAPDNIMAVLTLFYDYSDRYIKAFGKSSGVRRKIANWLADDNLSWQDTLQNISNEIIGLDCNGFVGNWLAAADHALKIGPNTRPRDVYDRRRVPRTSVDSIQGKDVVVWENFSHIAAIDWEADAGKPKFNICQSAGGGPRINEYTIQRAGAKTFRLSGGIPAKDVSGAVYIISMWDDN